MNYKLLESLIDIEKVSKRKLFKMLGIQKKDFDSFIMYNTLKIKDLENIATILNIPVTIFFQDKIEFNINDFLDENSIIYKQDNYTENLEKENKRLLNELSELKTKIIALYEKDNNSDK